MELRQLEYVVGVVDHAGFGRAARALHVSQPALSEGVARLEAELGARLFDRIGRRVVLTPAGDACLPAARRMLSDAAVLRASVGEVVGLTGGSLAVVALPTLAVDPLAGMIGAFRREHPGIMVVLRQPDDVAALLADVRDGRADVGVTELPVGTGLEAHRLVDQDLVVLVDADSPLARRRRVGIRDLAGVPLVTTPPGTSTRRLVDGAFAAAGIEPTIAVETDQREAILPLVVAGAGATFLPRPMAEPARRSGAVALDLVPRLRRTLGLVHRSGPLAPAARAFVAMHTAARPIVEDHGDRAH